MPAKKQSKKQSKSMKTSTPKEVKPKRPHFYSGPDMNLLSKSLKSYKDSVSVKKHEELLKHVKSIYKSNINITNPIFVEKQNPKDINRGEKIPEKTKTMNSKKTHEQMEANVSKTFEGMFKSIFRCLNVRGDIRFPKFSRVEISVPKYKNVETKVKGKIKKNRVADGFKKMKVYDVKEIIKFMLNDENELLLKFTVRNENGFSAQVAGLKYILSRTSFTKSRKGDTKAREKLRDELESGNFETRYENYRNILKFILTHTLK